MTDYEHVEVLLVEDSPHDAEMTMHALSDNKFLSKVHWVKDGVQALDFIGCVGEYAQRDPSQLPKVVLLDLKMPKVDGLDVLREIKGNERWRGIPVVIMTSSNEDRDVIESYQLGTNAYVVKPVDFLSFTEAVVRLGMFWLLVNKAP
jgi:two-component system response regulator